MVKSNREEFISCLIKINVRNKVVEEDILKLYKIRM